jgi:antitoxin (DNA-binding transcriptional repressor) of toxin-antitoxin stability system
MTATLEQTQSELLRLIHLAQRGEEVVITSQGQPVAKLTGLPRPRTDADRRAWLTKLARLRAATATGKTTPTTEEILEDLRAERG